MALWLCRQPRHIEDMSLAHRVMIFLIGILEAIVWSGCIFGWPQLVQVLKMNGIYSHLCQNPVDPGMSIFNGTTSGISSSPTEPITHILEYIGCSAQDERYALIYTMCCVLYATPGILIGYSLHHFGLAITRVAAGLMMTSGFLLLSAITIETPDYLWGGAILISVAGNTIRMCGLQFGNLFPQHCAAAMSVISGIFSVSAASFILFTYGASSGFPWHSTCYIYALVASLILVATVFIPVKHIPYEKSSVDNNNLDDESKEILKKQDTTKQVMIISKDKEADAKKKEEIPLSSSLLSLSNFLNVYWLFINMIGITIFATFFNQWINKFSKNTEEALYYSRLYGYANIFCVFFTFLPGFLINITRNQLKKALTLKEQNSHQGTYCLSGLKGQVAEVQAMIVPMVIVSITCTIQFCCLLIDHSWAVYLALICLAINRPACLGVGNPFTRLRFPADHFNRMLGIQGTLVSLFTMLQYAHFMWAQNYFYPAMITVVTFLILGLLHPLHLLNKSYITKSLKPIYPS